MFATFDRDTFLTKLNTFSTESHVRNNRRQAPHENTQNKNFNINNEFLIISNLQDIV
jgi:hypothetical protein